MKLRDEIESKRNIVYYTSPVESQLSIRFAEEYPKFLENKIPAKEFLANLQSYSEILIEEFKKEKEAEGWTFEEGKDGIPPAEQ